MGRRERLERKIEKRSEWAGKAEAKADVRFATAKRISDGIPFGQPILVGHHSERHARRDVERIHNNMHKACELADLAKHHESKAAGLERQLETSVFSDDPDAVEALEAKIVKAEAVQAKMKAANAAIRKAAKQGKEAQITALAALGLPADLLTPDFAGRVGFPSYAITNNNANIRRMKERIEVIKRQQARTAKAEAAGCVLVEEAGDYCRVTFPERPANEILAALRAAGFSWGGGSWTGKREKLPAIVTEK